MGVLRLELLERLGDRAPHWDSLVERTALPSPFMRSWWVDHAAGGDPVVLACLEHDGTLVGGVALEIDRIPVGPARIERVRFLGQGPLAPDHLDVLSHPDRRQDVLRVVGGWLLDGDRIIDLDGLVEASELPYLLDAPVISQTAAPYLPLQAPDPVARLGGRLRSTVRRSTRRLARDGFEVRRVPPEDAERALADLHALHERRWGQDSAFMEGWGAFSAAAAAGMAKGEVVIHELARGDTVIASELDMLAGGRMAFYQAGRLTDREFRGSGSALKAAVLHSAAASGCTEFDLLRGDEPYKHDWSSEHRTVLRARTGVGPRGAPAAAVMNLWFRQGPRLRATAGRLVGRTPSTETEDRNG